MNKENFEENQNKKTGMSRLMELATTKKPLIITAIILSVLASIASFIPYIAIFKVIQTIIQSLPNLSNINAENLIMFGWLAFGGVVLNILLYFFALAFSHLAAFGTLYQLKINFASHLAKVPLGFHILIGSGKLRKIMDENIEKVEEFIAHQLPDLVAALVAPIAMIGILLFVDWRFGLAALVGVVIAFFIQVSAYGNSSSKEMMNKYQTSIEEMNNAAVEYVRGISVVKAFKQTVYSFRQLHETIKGYTSMVIKYTLSWENSFSAFVTLANNIYLFVIPVGIIVGMNTTDYTAFASTFIFYIIFVPSIASILMKVMYVNSSGMRIINGVEAMDKLLEKPELVQSKNPKTADNFNIQFNNVKFSYDNNILALNGVTFNAKQGDITAIVGPSGGGKSTIGHLIPRFFDVTNGKITIGDVDIRDMSTQYLMTQVSFVFQDVFLFKQSIKDNIKMGNENATDEEVVEASKSAQCHEFIMKLPEGYNTIIGTQGIHLSGGEKQRIAIARAMIKNSPIVILDEATAFSDPENEHLIQKSFEKLMKNKTVILIAHRLSTVQSADKIIVLDNGRVIEEGKHNELIEKSGKYADMWKIYNESTSWKMVKKEEVIVNG